MISIRAKLALGSIITLGILFVLQLLVVSYTVRHVGDEFVELRLTHETELIFAALKINKKSQVLSLTTDMVAAFNQPFSGHYYQITVAKYPTLTSLSLSEMTLPVMAVNAGEVKMIYRSALFNQVLMVEVSGHEKQNLPVTIAVAQNVTDVDEDMGELMVQYAVISLLAVMVLLVIQMLILRRGLLPTQVAAQQLHAMQRGDIKQLDENLPNEIKPLVTEINRLLQLLGQRVQRSRNALGNLAHALKTPLTILTQLTETKTMQEDGVLHVKVTQQLHMMQRLMERELKRARFTQTALLGKRFVPDEDIPALVEMFESIYKEKDLAVDIDYPIGQSTNLDHEDMLEIIGNVLDNAFKWAIRIVLLELYFTPKALCIVIEDDGVGVARKKLRGLAQRGMRIDESVTGHGLGLAIVRDAIEHYKGTLTLDKSSRHGGLSVTMEIPLY